MVAQRDASGRVRDDPNSFIIPFRLCVGDGFGELGGRYRDH